MNRPHENHTHIFAPRIGGRVLAPLLLEEPSSNIRKIQTAPVKRTLIQSSIVPMTTLSLLGFFSFSHRCTKPHLCTRGRSIPDKRCRNRTSPESTIPLPSNPATQ